MTIILLEFTNKNEQLQILLIANMNENVKPNLTVFDSHKTY